MLDGYLGQTSGYEDYEDFMQKKVRIINGQHFKEKTSHESPILKTFQKKYHIKELYTSKYFN